MSHPQGAVASGFSRELGGANVCLSEDASGLGMLGIPHFPLLGRASRPIPRTGCRKGDLVAEGMFQGQF